MPPKRQCSCKQHNTFGTSESAVSAIASCKKFKKCAINYLQENGMLEAYHKYLCEACYSHALQESTTEKFTFNEFCKKIEEGDVSDEQFENISESFASLLRKRLTKDKHENDLDSLANTDFHREWFSCQTLKPFLTNLSSGIATDMTMQGTTETLLQLAIPNFIGPLHFARSVIAYFISGSKRIVELNARFSPSGSYPTVLQYLKKKTIHDHLPNVDQIFFFDNNQIMARSWNVQYDSKPLVSVVTTVVALVPPSASTIQESVEHMPGTWMTVPQIAAPADTSGSFRAERNIYLEKTINDLNGNVSTPAQKLRKIEFSGGKFQSEMQNPVDPYACIESKVKGQTKVILLNPILVNPCSYKSLEIVLDSIILKSNKRWVAIGCDGLPFSICSKMIDNYFSCSHCNQTFQKRHLFSKHVEMEGLQVDIDSCKKYNNVLLLPGFGHLDINITKAIFKLLWLVCLRDLAILLGWKSVKALTACEHCTDHHKATQILNILLTALNQELLRPFINACERNEVPQTIENLYAFAEKQNKNYQFLFKVNFTYLFAWKLLKIGMRRSNYRYMKMSIDKLSTLFYGLNMTTYMDLWYRFENTVSRAPEVVQDFIQRNTTMSQSGHPSKAEGGDFILESTNKKIKSHMPYGVPTDERWTRVCNNIDTIEKIQHALNSPDEEERVNRCNKYFRRFDDPSAVAEFAKKLRTYFAADDNRHTSTDGKTLDNALVEFDIKCNTNKLKYYQLYPNVLRICERVFVTPEDRSAFFDIGNKTKPEIQKIIFNVLKDIEDAGGDEEAGVLRVQWNEVKSGTKNGFLTFYTEVVQCLEEVTSRKENIEADVADADQ